MQITRQRRPVTAMDMSPMIDCVFQLLIFFMLSSTFLTPALKLTLPTAANDDPAESPEIMVTIGGDGEVYLNNRKLTLDQLPGELTTIVAASKKKVVTIRGDEKMRYEYFVKALDAATQANAENVLVQHQTHLP